MIHTHRAALTSHGVEGVLLLAFAALFLLVAAPAHASHPFDDTAYQVDVVLYKAVEVLVIMQDTVDSGYYDYSQKKESTEPYYDYSKDKTYTDTEYKKTTVSSTADLEQLLEQIKQLQALILLLLQLQQATLEQASE
jgi:hypothetical protein